MLNLKHTPRKFCRYHWQRDSLQSNFHKTLAKLRRQNRLVGDKSAWWPFIYAWPQKQPEILNRFIQNTYRFEPVKAYRIQDDYAVVWSYQDRLAVKALLSLLKPTFKHLVSKACFHIQGPSGVKGALSLTHKALQKNRYRYFMRIDIASFYASIHRKTLFEQLKLHFQDPRVLNYLEQIIHIPTLENGCITNPTHGIHRRSSLSPFFGAMYLKPLDTAFENKDGVFYVRYMDDILILTRSKQQYLKAKRKVQNILGQLKLKVSKTKTKMGPLTRGFHFLGIEFLVNEHSSPSSEATVAPAAQTQALQSQVSTTLHERCCVRALDKVRVMGEDSVPPEKVLRYLLRWTAWWSRAMPTITRSTCLERWTQRAELKATPLAWSGRALLHLLLAWSGGSRYTSA